MVTKDSEEFRWAQDLEAQGASAVEEAVLVASRTSPVATARNNRLLGLWGSLPITALTTTFVSSTMRGKD